MSWTIFFVFLALVFYLTAKKGLFDIKERQLLFVLLLFKIVIYPRGSHGFNEFTTRFTNELLELIATFFVIIFFDFMFRVSNLKFEICGSTPKTILLRSDDTDLNPKFGVVILKTAMCNGEINL